MKLSELVDAMREKNVSLWENDRELDSVEFEFHKSGDFRITATARGTGRLEGVLFRYVRHLGTDHQIEATRENAVDEALEYNTRLALDSLCEDLDEYP